MSLHYCVRVGCSVLFILLLTVVLPFFSSGDAEYSTSSKSTSGRRFLLSSKASDRRVRVLLVSPLADRQSGSDIRTISHTGEAMEIQLTAESGLRSSALGRRQWVSQVTVGRTSNCTVKFGKILGESAVKSGSGPMPGLWVGRHRFNGGWPE